MAPLRLPDSEGLVDEYAAGHQGLDQDGHQRPVQIVDDNDGIVSGRLDWWTSTLQIHHLRTDDDTHRLRLRFEVTNRLFAAIDREHLETRMPRG